jgi:aminoglycoside 6-adenylyltransferase
MVLCAYHRGSLNGVLFDNAMDADFVICSEKDVRRAIAEDDFDILKRGYRVLIDKIGLSEILPPAPEARRLNTPPAQSEYLNLVKDFWYHCVWCTKKLLRGEMWMAKSCLDVYLKGLLLQIIELHAHAKNGWDYDTWFYGRFLDQWAEPRVTDALKSAFARYDKNDIERALYATMDLFRTLAVEAADLLKYEYPHKADEKAAAWVKVRLLKTGEK